MKTKLNKNFHLVSLGCAKNTVDSESMAQILLQNGFQATGDAEQAEVLIVNTCGVIGPAKEESYDVLQGLAERKTDGQLLIATGCLTQRYGKEVVERVPGIDGVLGTRRWMDIMQLVTNIRENPHPEPLYHLPTEALTVGTDEGDILRISATGPSAYIKIADGCRRPCAFCAIPIIKGTAVSRPVDAIVNEARVLRDRGVREINLIAQDSTDYGHDIGIKNGLAHLLNEIVAGVPDMDWIRILYAYPGYVTDELIDVMATHKQVIPYLDMPLQHASPQTLKRMRRPANMDWVHKTLNKMRTAMPDLALRTTFIVGYPGETDAEFQMLMDFVEEIRFDRVGTFTFSFEPGTTSEPLGDDVPEEVKLERQAQVMTLQQKISLENNQAQIGKTLDVLIEEYSKDEETNSPIAIGRTYRDAPEIDGLVLIEGQPPIGEIVPIKINGALTYDLTGEVETNNIIILAD
ncbi:MAG: 30S ribosomal protein S12 methylthiotransferase RimO [Chloroflexota bacterium]